MPKQNVLTHSYLLHRRKIPPKSPIKPVESRQRIKNAATRHAEPEPRSLRTSLISLIVFR